MEKEERLSLGSLTRLFGTVGKRDGSDYHAIRSEVELVGREDDHSPGFDERSSGTTLHTLDSAQSGPSFVFEESDGHWVMRIAYQSRKDSAHSPPPSDPSQVVQLGTGEVLEFSIQDTAPPIDVDSTGANRASSTRRPGSLPESEKFRLPIERLDDRPLVPVTAVLPPTEVVTPASKHAVSKPDVDQFSKTKNRNSPRSFSARQVTSTSSQATPTALPSKNQSQGVPAGTIVCVVIGAVVLVVGAGILLWKRKRRRDLKRGELGIANDGVRAVKDDSGVPLPLYRSRARDWAPSASTLATQVNV